MTKDEIILAFSKLKKLQNGMDIPVGRKDSVKWLLKNLSVRNAGHPNFKETLELLEKLTKAGVHNSSNL